MSIVEIHEMSTPVGQLDASTDANRLRNAIWEAIDALPTNLYDAIIDMQNDQLILDTLGEHVSQNYITAKLKEWGDYSARVSQWELDQYLSIF